MTSCQNSILRACIFPISNRSNIGRTVERQSYQHSLNIKKGLGYCLAELRAKLLNEL